MRDEKMKTYRIINGAVYIDREFRPATLELSGGTLKVLRGDSPDGEEAPGSVRENERDGCRDGRPLEDFEIIDAAGRKIIPGLIDIHTHGAVGVDVNGASAEDLRKMGRFFAGNGTTAWLASILTDTVEQTEWCIDQYLAWDQSGADAAQLLGLHLEGPFLAKEYKGAMPEHLLRKPDVELARRYQKRAQGNIRYMTVSPELEGAAELIAELGKLGIAAAIGHSGADYETSLRAIRAGAVCSTHTGNAMRTLDRHEPAILGAALESDIYSEMICDGLHLHPGIVRLWLKVKGWDRMAAITDSIMAAGLPDGQYHLGVNEVVVRDGDARLASGGARAGSTLTQIRALRNVMAFTGEPLGKVLPLFTENPAKVIGVFGRKGSIEDGKDADLVILDDDLNIEAVFLRGKLLRDA